MITHEIFVPREIVLALWTTPEHLKAWHPQLANAELDQHNAPDRLVFRCRDDGGSYELQVGLTDLGGTTNIEVATRLTEGTPSMPTPEELNAQLAALEEYLAVI